METERICIPPAPSTPRYLLVEELLWWDWSKNVSELVEIEFFDSVLNYYSLLFALILMVCYFAVLYMHKCILIILELFATDEIQVEEKSLPLLVISIDANG